MLPIKVEHEPFTLYFDLSKSGGEQYILLESDEHFDSIYCNRQLWKYHLSLAKERNAIILNGGDLFDAMQGKFDPRRNMDELLPEFRTEDYYDVVTEAAAEWLRPFAQNIFLLSRGNHELSVLHHANTDLISRVAYLLSNANPEIHTGGYWGWVNIVLMEKSQRRGTVTIRWNHGASGGVVTKGTTHVNRQSAFIEGVDVIWNGHNHQAYILPQPKEYRINGTMHRYLQWHVRTPGYKDAWGKNYTNWEAQKMSLAGPTPQGAAWVHIKIRNHKIFLNILPEFSAE